MAKAKDVYSRFRRHNQGTYRSGLEEANSEYLRKLGIDPNYEEYYLEYEVPATRHRYTPDFVLPNGIIIETKGLWDSDDRKKHLLIKEQYPELDIRFIFSRAKTRLYKGSASTYASFCDKYGIKYADKEIPVEWLDEESKRIPEGVLKAHSKEDRVVL